MSETRKEVAVIGAGPIGLELAVALKKDGVDYIHFDKGQVGQTMTWFPRLMRFNTSADRLAIAGVPIPRVDESKCNREEFLAYLRSVNQQFDLDIRSYETVTSIVPEDGGFAINTNRRGSSNTYHACKVVLATGDMHNPRMLGLPGEDQSHVSHYFEEPHRYFRQKLLVVGGKNSAVEAAIRCHRCGADVTLSYRGREFEPEHIKFWLLPEIRGFAKRGEIKVLPRTVPRKIHAESVTLEDLDTGAVIEVDTDFVLLLVGYTADMSLLRSAGITLEGDGEKPSFDPDTMETDVPGLYIAGTATAGSQQSYNVFIENCHVHIERIMAHIKGCAAPDTTVEYELPET